MAEDAVKKASDEEREVDIAYKNWYFYVQDAFACGELKRDNVRTDNTTFQQVFFGPAVSCGTYVQCKSEQLLGSDSSESRNEFYQEKEVVNKFYQSLKDGINVLRNKTMKADTALVLLRNLRLEVIKIISDAFKTEFDNDYSARKNEYIECGLDKPKVDGAEIYGYKGIKETYTYKRDRKKIYAHYISHREFYLYYLESILIVMNKSGMERIDRISEKACDKLRDILSYIPSAEGKTDTLELTVYYLYCLILASTDREEFIRKNSESGHLSGLTNESDINIRLQRDDFISVTEYYPVNTVERLGALEKLADKDNIYALQELYFLYQNNTVLYNASGEKRLLLKKDPVKSAEIYSKLSVNAKANRLPLFRNEEFSTQKNSLLSMLEDYRCDYDSIDSDDSGDKTEFLKNMTTDLYKKFTQKEIPFNIELVLFLRRVLEKNPDVTIEIDNKSKSAADIMLKLNKYIEAFPLAEEFEPPGDKGIDFMESLIRLCEIGFPEEMLVDICKRYNNYDKLSEYNYRVIDKKSYYEKSKIGYRTACKNSGEPVDSLYISQLNSVCNLWEKLQHVLDKALSEFYDESLS